MYDNQSLLCHFKSYPKTGFEIGNDNFCDYKCQLSYLYLT